MGYYSGNTGTIQYKKFGEGEFRENTHLRITQWTLNSSAQLLDTTTLGVYDKSSVYGIRTHTGTLQLLYYTDEETSSPRKNSASWFIAALTRPKFHQNASGSEFEGDSTDDSWPIRLSLYLKRFAPGSTDKLKIDAITFDANITSVGYASTVNEVTSVQVQFEAFGQIDKLNL